METWKATQIEGERVKFALTLFGGIIAGSVGTVVLARTTDIGRRIATGEA